MSSKPFFRQPFKEVQRIIHLNALVSDLLKTSTKCVYAAVYKNVGMNSIKTKTNNDIIIIIIKSHEAPQKLDLNPLSFPLLKCLLNCLDETG